MAQIIWTKLALSQLEKAVKYIAETNHPTYAKRVLDKTFKKVQKLQTHPYLGQKESLLDFKSLDYRYLLVWSHKIIYRVNKGGDKVYIVRFFHTSQNPSKMF